MLWNNSQTTWFLINTYSISHSLSKSYSLHIKLFTAFLPLISLSLSLCPSDHVYTSVIILSSSRCPLLSFFRRAFSINAPKFGMKCLQCSFLNVESFKKLILSTFPSGGKNIPEMCITISCILIFLAHHSFTLISWANEAF